MNTEQVRDLIRDLLAWRATQGPLTTGDRITGTAATGAGQLTVTFTGGTAFTITVEDAS